MYRENYLDEVNRRFAVNPVVALLGPRQCGKTTLAKSYIETLGNEQKVHYFDLEKPSSEEIFANPYTILEDLEGLIVIDEVQKIPELFKSIRVLVDEHKKRRFLILGSASRDLIKQSSETLAGRISYIELTPFMVKETGDYRRNWLRGGFPKAYLADNYEIAHLWLSDYVRTFLERDIPALGFKIPSENLRRFWLMLVNYHGNIINCSEIGKSLGISHHTVKNYLDILVGTYMVRELKPWYENISKRQIKSSKIYIRDSGILHNLLRIKEEDDVLHHPKLGASWEGFALEEVIRSLKIDQDDCYFWSTQNKAELDLLVTDGLDKIGFEFKFADKPKPTRSAHIAVNDLGLKSLTIIYPGKERYKFSDKITIVGLQEFLQGE